MSSENLVETDVLVLGVSLDDYLTLNRQVEDQPISEK